MKLELCLKIKQLMVILKAFKLLPTEFLTDVKTTIAAKAETLRNATPKMKTEKNKIPNLS